MLSTWTSMPCASIVAMRWAAALAMCRSGRSDGPPSLSPTRASASGTAQCACTSMTLTRLPETTVWRRAAWAPAGRAASRSQPTKARLASAPAPDSRNSRRLVMVLPPPVSCGCRLARRQQPQQLMRLGLQRFSLGAHRNVFVPCPGFAERLVVVRKNVAGLPAGMDVERFFQVRQVVDRAQARRMAVGVGPVLVVKVVSPDVHRVGIAGRGDADVEDRRKQRLPAEGPMLVERAMRLAPAPAGLVIAEAPAQIGQRRLQR